MVQGGTALHSICVRAGPSFSPLDPTVVMIPLRLLFPVPINLYSPHSISSMVIDFFTETTLATRLSQKSSLGSIQHKIIKCRITGVESRTRQMLRFSMIF